MSAFPQPFLSTVSHWQATNRGPTALFNHGRDEALPTDVADYVVIGAGMAGASLAYHLTRPGVADDKTVVVLEAKDVASGASGRNGGHVAPYSFGAFPQLVRPLKECGAGVSPQEAVEVIEMEQANLDYVTELVATNKWDVDLWRGHKLEVRVTEAAAESMKSARDAWLEARSHTRYATVDPRWEWIDDPAEAKKISRTDNALGLSRGPAGSIHPHKLATAFLRAAIESGRARLYSWAPVTEFKESKDVTGAHGEWSVDCGERGVVRAKEVIVCTNAHTHHLFPGDAIDKHLTPFQGQAALITPTPSFSGTDYLKNTYVLEKGPYLMFTPQSGIVMGLSDVVGRELGPKSDIYGVTDDSYVKPEHRKWLEEYCAKNFTGWGNEAPGEGATRVWSGIQCASRDTLPLVGRVPSRPGLWLAVGFHGHGMARIPFVTRSLAHHLVTGEWDSRLPASFEISTGRLLRAQTSPPFISSDAELAANVNVDPVGPKRWWAKATWWAA